ncbi:HIT family protein [Piscibacillus salipiscarius]|uniref:HIT family protein n=1 Tax=Piscibacillus salipiscarius TaxID=299480 RepID=A0ABW5Q778_9BACI|nr:HIT domain-containing protein [Piscibacillus salipiscarius]
MDVAWVEIVSQCVFCYTELDPRQKIVLSNDHCYFLQLDYFRQHGVTLEGAGVVVPKNHRETVFDLTEEEWQSTFELLQEVKQYLDDNYLPDGYNIGWNCGEVGGQSIFHAHLHVLPRYKNEALAGKGIRYLLKAAENKRK